MRIADTTLEIKPIAQAVLRMLDYEPNWPENWDVEHKYHYMTPHTAAWYNGRECGYVLHTYCNRRNQTHIITFGEDRSSDAIFVDVWTIEGRRINPPTTKDFTDEAYKNRRFFRQVDDAVRYIENSLHAFVVARPQ